MLARRKRNAGRSLLLRGCTLGALGWIAIGITDAQQADSGKPVVPLQAVPAASIWTSIRPRLQPRRTRAKPADWTWPSALQRRHRP